MNDTYTILSKEHWQVMQLDPNKIYKLWRDMDVWQIGKGIMQDYPICVELNNKYWNSILWGNNTVH